MKVISRDFYPHHALEDYCLCVRDHYVYKYVYETETLEQYFKIPAASQSLTGRLKDVFARSFIGRRLRRTVGLSHVIELPSKTVLIVYDKVYRYVPSVHDVSKQAEVTCLLEPVDAMPPLRNGIGINPETGDCYFSEYSNDPTRAKSIFRIFNDGKNIERVFQFDTNEIKHVHSVTWDQYRRGFWVTTGDSDQQSWFYFTGDNFKTLKKVHGGDQTWRAVSIIPTPEGLIWGMDAGKDASESDLNYIFNLNLATGERTKVQKIDSPAYHSYTTASGRYIINTNYEPGCKQPISPEAAVWVSENGINWHKEFELNYHPTPEINGSKYAYIYSPSGIVPDGHCLFTATNVEKYSMQMLRLSFNK